MYFGTWNMWKTLIVDIALSVTCAMGIGLQFKCGRFDFSGGAIMLLTSIVAGNVALSMDNNIVMMVLLCLAGCVLLSVLVALLYIYGRVPIVIITIGMAMLYESITCLIYGSRGVNIVSNMTLRLFSTYPAVLFPFIMAVAIYAFYSYCTVSGKQAQLLANNQQAAVNIGLNEKKSVLVSYAFSGLIFGFATVIYMANGMHRAATTFMSTVGELFSNILPVFIGLIVGSFCGDTIGIVVGSLSLCLMSYGLKATFSDELGAAISTICMGVFILIINIIGSQGGKIARLFHRKDKEDSAA
jgi:ribose transport system permease protein